MEPDNFLENFFPPDNLTKKCGCYIKNPKQYSISYKQAMMPLKHIDYHVEIANSLMNVTLAQKYMNPSDIFLEVDFAFPIHPESAIYKFRA